MRTMRQGRRLRGRGHGARVTGGLLLLSALALLAVRACASAHPSLASSASSAAELSRGARGSDSGNLAYCGGEPCVDNDQRHDPGPGSIPIPTGPREDTIYDEFRVDPLDKASDAAYDYAANEADEFSEDTRQRAEEARKKVGHAAQEAGRAVQDVTDEAGRAVSDTADGAREEVDRQQREAHERGEAAHRERQARRERRRRQREAREARERAEQERRRAAEGGSQEDGELGGAIDWAKHPLNIDNAADSDRAYDDYGLVGGPLHRGRGQTTDAAKKWRHGVPTAQDVHWAQDRTLAPEQRSQQMEGFPFVDQKASAIAGLEDKTADSISHLKRELEGVRAGLERSAGRSRHDRGGLRSQVPKQTRGRDSVICAVPGLADLATGLGSDWCAHSTGHEKGVAARPLMRTGPPSPEDLASQAEAEEEERLKRGAEAVDAAEDKMGDYWTPPNGFPKHGFLTGTQPKDVIVQVCFVLFLFSHPKPETLTRKPETVNPLPDTIHPSPQNPRTYLFWFFVFSP